MSEKLSILDDSSDSEVELKINKNYANRYNTWRNKEELQKYKDLKKEDDDSESSSESEEEVSECDEELLRVISLVKGRDPRVFDKNVELFTEKEIKKRKTVKEKPMFMKDYERNLVLERGGKFSDEEDENVPYKEPTYDEQQEDLKKSFKALVNDSDEDDDLLQVRTKTNKEEEEDDADYLKWLKGEEKEVSEDIKKDMSHLRNYWSNPDLNEDEKFLRDFLLNKKYLEKDDEEIPSYEEITSGRLSDDEREIEKQQNFEHKFNFRFEEPDEEFIKRYPRIVGDSLRKTDNRRKQKRDDKTERRRKEREQRQEELKRLKALKRKEIEEKFLKLKEISGQEEINFDESDMESDFDPDKHDKKMREMFNDDYYGVEEVQKPEFPFDEELDSENWNAWTGENIISVDDEKVKSDNKMDLPENYDQPGCSASFKNDFEKEMIEATLPKKKVKKKSLFAKVISQPKPIYDPDGKSFDDYLDEYYKLDYEDVIGDMPVRYKYRKVVPNDFGLSVDEILAADDRELNRWCSVKKTCQYRNDDEELYDVQAFQKKSQNIFIKKKLFSSLYAPKETDDNLNNAAELEDEKDSTGKASMSTVTGSQIKTVSEDVMNSYSNVNLEHNENQSSFIENSDLKKKSKKRKRKEKSLNSHVDTDSKVIDNADRSIDFDSCKNSLEISDSFEYDVDTERKNIDNSSMYNQLQNTPKKKKHKEKCNKMLHKEVEPECFDVINESIDTETSSNLLDSNLEISKSTKRKRETQDNFPDQDSNVGKDNISKKKLNKLKGDCPSNVNDSNLVVKSSPQEALVKKNKKKRKKKKKGAGNEAATNHNHRNMSNTHKFKDKKHIGKISGDKRLGLSDERLAAYGINPKKFKNKIIYSKK